MGPWGNRDGGGEAVRVQQRRRRGRAGAGQAAGAAAAARGVTGVRGVGRRRRSRLADAGAGQPCPWRLLLVGYWESGRP